MRFPIKVTEAEVYIRFAWASAGSGLELDNGVLSFAESIKGFSHKHVCGSRIRLLPQNLTKTIERAWILFGLHASLRKDMLQFHVFGVGAGDNLKMGYGFHKLTVA